MSVRGFNTGTGVERYDYNALDNVPIITKASIGLGNVDNTSDTNKPVSTAQQTALNGKVDKVTGKGLSTNDYTNADKQKVDDAALQSDLDGLSLQLNDETTGLDSKAPVILETVSGAIASFSDGADNMKIQKLVVNIEPIQAGSGEPSPDNIRPISGRTGAEITYNGNIVSVTFPTTIYGGEDDIISGKLKSIKNILDLGTLTYSKSSKIQNGFVAVSGMPSDFPLAPDTVFVPKWLCSQYKVYSNKGIEAAGVDYAIAWRVSGKNKGVIVRDSRYADYYANNDMESFKTAMSGVQLCYERAEPVEYTLTPQEMKTLYGANNIWADAGPVSVNYPADTKLYIDGKLAEIQATILENIGG